MASGGHARSGPPPTEGSARSDARGYTLSALPSEGWSGDIPDWPIVPGPTETEWVYWERAWRTPQAFIWSRPEWRWLIPDVARYVRLSVRCDEPDAPASLIARLPGAKDDVGMTAAGLARFGAKIAADEVAAKRAEADPEPVGPKSSRARMKIVQGSD